MYEIEPLTHVDLDCDLAITERNVTAIVHRLNALVVALNEIADKLGMSEGRKPADF